MTEIDLNTLDIHHHFGGGVYAKETRISAGHVLVQHKHTFEHLSILASGKVIVGHKVYEGPCVLTMSAEEYHSVAALTDAIWYCLWVTDETDVGKIDRLMIMSPEEAKELA